MILNSPKRFSEVILWSKIKEGSSDTSISLSLRSYTLLMEKWKLDFFSQILNEFKKNEIWLTFFFFTKRILLLIFFKSSSYRYMGMKLATPIQLFIINASEYDRIKICVWKLNLFRNFDFFFCKINSLRKKLKYVMDSTVLNSIGPNYTRSWILDYKIQQNKIIVNIERRKHKILEKK